MIVLIFICSSLFAAETISPKLSYVVHDDYLQTLHSIFSPLEPCEKSTDWGKEYLIGMSFAAELDLYGAITAFKRAAILIPDEHMKRRREIDYQIINAYYLAGMHKSVIETFDKSLLANIEPTFAAFHDLVVMLYDSLTHDNNKERAERMLKTMERYFPYEKMKMEISDAIITGNLELMKKNLADTFIETSIASLENSLDLDFLSESKGLLTLDSSSHLLSSKNLESLYHLKECKEASNEILKEYHSSRKNPYLAGGLNALLPGLGYLYLGQKQSAFTALMLNSLTTAAAYYFYQSDNIAAALLTLSFESGWYFGGIYGAKEEASFYNTKMFEKASHFRMRDHKLYPILMLRHGF